MTGRDLILYILQNQLEDEPVFKDGKFIGFVTAGEAAVTLKVGIPTVLVLIGQNKLEGYLIGDQMYVPVSALSNRG